MSKTIFKKIRLFVILFGIVFIAYYFFISPVIVFRGYEKKLEDAARRYFELNSNELPTGQRVKTLKLQTLYHKSFIEGDFYRPLSKKTCSLSNSWVKVRNEDNEYKYYVYLDCGFISSNVDHDGPEIKLNGDSEITLGVGDEFKDAGVSSVVDKKEGKINVKDVTIKGEVDTSKVGTYEIKYTAYDSLVNESTVTRTVTVVKKFSSTIKKNLGDKKYFTNSDEIIRVRLSNQLFEVIGLDGDDVIIVSSEDVANVNHSKIDEWLDYYYKYLNDFTKKSIVEKKYCNDTLSEDKLAYKKCNSYTKKKKIYIPSVQDVNLTGGNKSFLKKSSMTWVSNNKNKKEAYLTRNFFVGESIETDFLSYPETDNYGVRPKMTIDGDILITGGDGSLLKPYVFGDTKVVTGGDLLNTRETGEYVNISNYLWRVLEVDNEGNTKVILADSVSDLREAKYVLRTEDSKIVYDPKNENSLGYYMNNYLTKYIKTDYFVRHEIEVPVYKNNIIYGEEVSTEKYKVVFSAPSMYDLFSAQPIIEKQHEHSGYWLKNISKAKMKTGLISLVGVPINVEIMESDEAGVRPIAYVKKNAVVVSGKGTIKKPYVVK